jgi:hypothetical protein
MEKSLRQSPGKNARPNLKIFWTFIFYLKNNWQGFSLIAVCILILVIVYFVVTK